MPSTFKNRTTPGVYVTEFNAFPPSVVGVQTAVPGFVGYTEKAEIDGKPVFFKPILINSLAGYEQIFGKGFKAIYDIDEADDDATNWDFTVGDTNYVLEQTEESRFNLYYSLRLFFDNGGGTCFIVSVGDYDAGVAGEKLVKGLAAIREQVGPTMLVVPDAVLLPPNAAVQLPESGSVPTSTAFATVVQEMLRQSLELQDRVAILDVYGTESLTQQDVNASTELDELIQQFHVDVGSVGLSYGMAYFPFLNTSVVGPADINYTNFNPDQEAKEAEPGGSNNRKTKAAKNSAKDTGAAKDPDDEEEPQTELQRLLTEVATSLYEDQPTKLATVEGYIADITNDEADVTTVNQNLSNALPPYQQWQNIIAAKLNVLPPSGAMAGVFTFNDLTRGVWNAPANTVLASVISPSVALDDEQQGNLNVPLDGKAIDVIRFFVGRGPVVWGARTLDGNSNDWRYIQVRRTIVYIEQSIKNALNPFVFAANDGQTWATVTSLISNFLEGLWTQGGLLGDKASEAFTVQCGLGSTMTPLDILQGYMVVQVTLQLIRPAEFIELTFKQKMGN